LLVTLIRKLIENKNKNRSQSKKCNATSLNYTNTNSNGNKLNISACLNVQDKKRFTPISITNTYKISNTKDNYKGTNMIKGNINKVSRGTPINFNNTFYKMDTNKLKASPKEASKSKLLRNIFGMFKNRPIEKKIKLGTTNKYLNNTIVDGYGKRKNSFTDNKFGKKSVIANTAQLSSKMSPGNSILKAHEQILANTIYSKRSSSRGK